MSSGLGIGCYQGATFRHRGAGLYLAHLCPDVARQIRQDEPDAYIVGRFDDGDASGVAIGQGDANAAASGFWFSYIAPVLHSYPGVYNLVLGLCELWPKPGYTAGLLWRAAFELALCRLVKAAGYRYGLGSVPTGNLEPGELHLFADVIRESECIVYHAYLKPGRLNVAEETEPYWALRPTRMWVPELRRLGLPVRIMYTEVGPFTSDVHGEALARLEVDVAALVQDDCKRVGAMFLGAATYGSGMLGSETPWELRDAEQIVIDAKPRFELAAPAPAPASPPAPTKGATHVPRLWLALTPSNQAYNRWGTTDEQRQMTAFADAMAVIANRRDAINCRVFAGQAETDTDLNPKLHAQLDQAYGWLNTAPTGTLTVGMGLHTDSGTTVQVGGYWGNASITRRLAEALREQLHVFFAGSQLRGANYEALGYQQWTRAYGRHCPVILELGSHQVPAMVARLASNPTQLATMLVDALLAFFALPLTLKPAPVTAPPAPAPVDATTDALNGIAYYIAAAQSASNLAAAKAAADAAWNKMAALKAAIGR